MDNPESSILHRIMDLNEAFNKLEEVGPIMRKSEKFSEKFRLDGNKLFKQGKHNREDHKQLISLYTSSISFAPKDSEELVKGYSNRSAVLMHLHRYQEALIDIDRALSVTKSDDLKAKLKSRRERCLKLIDESDVILPVQHELPTIQHSVKFPNASEAVDVQYSEKFGRHLIATRDIKPGEIIVAEESYACFPEHDRIHFICTHCLRFAWNGIPCDSCVLAIFCSEKCKNEAWQEYHDVECSVIRSMFLITEEDSITKAMVSIRSFAKAVKIEGFKSLVNEIKTSSEQKDHVEQLLSNGLLDSHKFRSYYNLIAYPENLKNNFKRSHFNCALLIVALLQRHTNIIPVGKWEDLNSAEVEILKTSVKVIMKLLNILALNTFLHQGLFCDCKDTNSCKASCDLDRGKLLAATCSLINHSCCPNVCRLFLPGKKIVMYTVIPVKKGQQLCDSYGPVFTEKKAERQKYLQENYFFLCNCQACEEDWPQLIEFELYKNPITAAPTFDKFLKDFKKYFPDQKLDDKNTLCKIIKRWYPDPEKFVLEKVIILSSLVYKYFGHHTAYCHCLYFNLYIDMYFLKTYGEKSIIPNSC